MAGETGNGNETGATPITTPTDQMATPSGATTGNTTINGTDPSQQQQPQGATPGQAAPTPAPQSAPQAPQGATPPAQAQAPAKPTWTQSVLSRARQISDEMVGGDPYKTNINPTTGETTRVRQPLSRSAITLSLIGEILQSGLAGAGAHGPNAVGQAAEAGLKQGQQIADQREANQAQQDQQSQTDLRNRQQVITNLLQTRLLAQNLGRQSLEQSQESVKADADNWAQHQQDPTSIIGQDMSHDDAYAMLNKQPMGTANVLITGAHPRTDPKTGQLVYQLPTGQIVPEDTPGAYVAPNFTYAVVKADSKVNPVDEDGNLKPDYQYADDTGYANFSKGPNGKLASGVQMTSMASQAALRGSQIAKTTQQEVDATRATQGLDPVSIKGDLKNDSNVRQGLLIYSAALNAPGGNHASAYNAVLTAQNGKYASAAGTIQNWFGGAGAVAGLDAKTAAQNFASAVRGGQPIVTRADAEQAEASSDKTVSAMGSARIQQLNKEEAQQKSQDAYATESAHVWGEKEIDAAKIRLQQQGGISNPYFNEAPDPVTGLKENYLNSLADGQLIRSVIKGIANINLKTNAGIAIAKEAEQASNGRFDSTKYEGYQRLRNQIAGKQGDSFSSGSTALGHLSSMVQAADRVTATPLLSTIASKGGLGHEVQDRAKEFQTARDVAASELGKAVEGKLLTEGEHDDWEARIKGWSPEETKSGAKALANLLYQRMREKRDQLRQLAPAGVVTGLHGMSSEGVDAYNNITGGHITAADQELNNDSAPSSQLANSITPVVLKVTSDGKMQYIQGQGWKPVPGK